MWLIGENGELVNLALLRAQQNQGSWSVTVLAQGSNVCLLRASESDCKARVDVIKGEMIKGGVKFI